MKRFVLALLLLAVVMLGASSLLWNELPAEKTVEDESLATPAPGTEEKEILPDESFTPLAEVNWTPQENQVRLCLAGDIVLHLGLHEEAALPGGGYDYAPIFEDVEQYVREADLSLCCLEAALVEEGEELTGYPLFHAPDDVAYSLKDVGFDIINMASNHAVDGFRPGIIRTLDVLDDAGLDHVGTYRTQEERDENNGILVKEVNGISIAFLDYTYGTNAIPITGFEYAVNVYYIDYLSYFSMINYAKVEADMAAARALNTDIIAVTVHWGGEYQTYAVPQQTNFANYLFEQGADLVIGGHPHVPAPMETRRITDENGETRTGYLCYCLGNLISCQDSQYTPLTSMVQVEITKDPYTGETGITKCEYVPMMMVDLEDYGITDADWRYRLWDLREAIADYERGDDRGVMNEELYTALCRGLEDCRAIFGSALEEK